MCASLSKNQFWFGLRAANSFDSREQVRKSRKMIGEVNVTKVGRPNKRTRKDRATQPIWTLEGLDEQKVNWTWVG